MKTKIISNSMAFGICQIELALNDCYANRKLKNIDTWLDACREIAEINDLTVDFQIIKQFSSTGIANGIYNVIVATFRDIGDPIK